MDFDISPTKTLDDAMASEFEVAKQASHRACGASYQALVYLSKDDIKNTIADIGLRAEFRIKLFEWRKTEHDFVNDSITDSSIKVNNWLINNEPNTPKSFESNTTLENSTASKGSKRGSKLSKAIKLQKFKLHFNM
ncbi:hypothetical protein FQR65_LT04335 [Abscondita terminalis]|nr:hypothetical protein FQR65_LT04335 [Abscondita terminalis]